MRRAALPLLLPLLLSTGLAAACDRGPDPAVERERAGRALRGLVVYPRSTLVSLAAGDEAAEIILSSPDSVERVAGWFRQALPLNGWTVEREGRDAAGAVTIFAQKGERPVWISLRPTPGGPGTSYTMLGAFAGLDSATADSTRR